MIISKGAVDGMLSSNFESVSSHVIGTTWKETFFLKLSFSCMHNVYTCESRGGGGDLDVPCPEVCVDALKKYLF